MKPDHVLVQENEKALVPGFVIEYTAKRLKSAFQKTLTTIKAGITADQWVVMHQLYEQEALSQHEIADRCTKDRPTITRILDILEKKDMIRRTQDKNDRRSYIVSLTPGGKKTVKGLLPKVKAFRINHFEGLTKRDLDHLMYVLEKINKNIKS